MRTLITKTHDHKRKWEIELSLESIFDHILRNDH